MDALIRIAWGKPPRVPGAQHFAKIFAVEIRWIFHKGIYEWFGSLLIPRKFNMSPEK